MPANRAILTCATLLLLPPLTAAAPAVYLGQLTDYLFAFFDGNEDASWEGKLDSNLNIQGGYAGDIVVNGYAHHNRAHEIAHNGTIYTTSPSESVRNMRDWERAIADNPGEIAVAYDQGALFNILQNDFNMAMTEICGLSTTANYAMFDFEIYADWSATQSAGAVHTDLDFQNNIAEMIVIDTNKWRMDIDEYIYISGDADDLIVIRWGMERNTDGSCTYKEDVKFWDQAGIIPAGDLTPDRMIHTAGNLGSTLSPRRMRRDLAEENRRLSVVSPHIPPQPTRPDGTPVPRSSAWGPSNFFVGYWLTLGDYASGVNQWETANLDDAVFIGGWYTPTVDFFIKKGGQHVPQKSFDDDASSLFDVSMTCTIDMDDPCYADEDLRGIALMSLTQALVIKVYEGSGPGTITRRNLLRGGEKSQQEQDNRSLVKVNVCTFCFKPYGWMVYPCGRRNLQTASLPHIPHRRHLDSTEVEYPVIIEHHSMSALFQHYGYEVTPAQGACIADKYCTLEFVMHS